MVIRTSFAVALVLSLVFAASALGAATRAEYIAQVDPICKRVNDKTAPLNKAAVGAIKKGKFRKAGSKVAAANRIFRPSIAQVAAVPPPAADQSLISSWLDLIRHVADLNDQLASALKHENLKAVKKVSKKGTRTFKQINGLVGTYGFQQCN